MPQDLTKECYQKSIDLLIKNSSNYGTLACGTQPNNKAINRNYLSIFSRDACICSLGMVATKKNKLVSLAKKNIITLAKHQAHNGEIPNYVKPEVAIVDFWRLGSIDATLWWLIAVDFYHQNTKDKELKNKLKPKIIKALNWLSCQEHNNDFLLRQTEASDWADIMPRNGKVLYTNALWYKVKKIYGLYETNETFNNFNLLFFPYNNRTNNCPKSDQHTIDLIRKKKQNGYYYLSFAGYMYWGEEIDVYGNSLAILSDLANMFFERKFIKEIENQKIIAGFPVPTTFNPITENSRLWRKYMESHKQNYPYQYHNGGTWPYTACFYAMALYKSKKRAEAEKELEKIAHLNSAKKWEFNEWFHTKTGHARGMKHQSWNAGAFLLAYHYINGDVEF